MENKTKNKIVNITVLACLMASAAGAIADGQRAGQRLRDAGCLCADAG
ncbi:hypothetical protein [Ewingella americana]|nr:hypothetical protein [Ewingella americana]